MAIDFLLPVSARLSFAHLTLLAYPDYICWVKCWLGKVLATRKLRNSLKRLAGLEEEEDMQIFSNLPKIHSHQVKRRRIRSEKEFHLDAQVDGYDIKDVMLYLGSDVNILPKKS